MFIYTKKKCSNDSISYRYRYSIQWNFNAGDGRLDLPITVHFQTVTQNVVKVRVEHKGSQGRDSSA